MMRIAILLPSLEDSQLTRSVVSQGNRIVASSASVDISVFYETLAPSPVVPNFATSQMLDCYGFTGVAVATTLSTAEKLLGMTGPTVRAFYVFDLEWTRNPRAFRDNHDVYGNKELQLFCRSQSHADMIANCWNRTATVVPDFDISLLIRSLGNATV